MILDRKTSHTSKTLSLIVLSLVTVNSDILVYKKYIAASQSEQEFQTSNQILKFSQISCCRPTIAGEVFNLRALISVMVAVPLEFHYSQDLP